MTEKFKEKIKIIDKWIFAIFISLWIGVICVVSFCAFCWFLAQLAETII